MIVQKLPVRLILDRAGLVGNDGPTHHGSFDLTYLGTLPNIVIMAPSDEIELMNMVQVNFASGRSFFCLGEEGRGVGRFVVLYSFLRDDPLNFERNVDNHTYLVLVARQLIVSC